jgi:hypothetical protein
MFQGFINRMGRYPPGTFLKLGDGRVIRTTSVVRSPETFALPRGILMPPGKAEWVDLAKGGAIAEVLSPA